MRGARAALVLFATVFVSTVDAQPLPGNVAPSTSLTQTTDKRCQAAQRRVERQEQVVRDFEARAAKDREARARCTSKRDCARLDRILHAHEARQTRYDRQLAQYEADAKRLCAAG